MVILLRVVMQKIYCDVNYYVKVELYVIDFAVNWNSCTQIRVLYE